MRCLTAARHMEVRHTFTVCLAAAGSPSALRPRAMDWPGGTRAASLSVESARTGAGAGLPEKLGKTRGARRARQHDRRYRTLQSYRSDHPRSRQICRPPASRSGPVASSTLEQVAIVAAGARASPLPNGRWPFSEGAARVRQVARVAHGVHPARADGRRIGAAAAGRTRFAAAFDVVANPGADSRGRVRTAVRSRSPSPRRRRCTATPRRAQGRTSRAPRAA